jgi:hypothetical protein
MASPEGEPQSMIARFALLAAALVLSGSAFAACQGLGDQRRPVQICFLEQNPNGTQKYDPQARGANYQPPNCGGTLGETLRSHIEMAFRLAPAILQEDLCRLNTIFVNPTKADEVSPYDNQSFGVWENPSDQGNGSYIFLAQNQLLRTIAAAEADIQTKFLREVGATGRSVTYAITPNSQELGTLSVMLHEMAHVKWFAERVFENPCYLRESMIWPIKVAEQAGPGLVLLRLQEQLGEEVAKIREAR